MSRRAWLPHPPKTLADRRICRSGLPRFASLDLARAALPPALGAVSLTAEPCAVCGGAHHRTLTFNRS